jgi:hypothetical protein
MISLSILNHVDNLKKILWSQKKIIMNNHLNVILKISAPQHFLKIVNVIQYTKINHYLK